MKREMTKTASAVDDAVFPMELFDAPPRTGARGKSKTSDEGGEAGAYVCEPIFLDEIYQSADSWLGAA